MCFNKGWLRTHAIYPSVEKGEISPYTCEQQQTYCASEDITLTCGYHPSNHASRRVTSSPRHSVRQEGSSGHATFQLLMRHSVKTEYRQTDFRSKSCRRSRCTLSTIMLLVCAMVASGHSGVQTYGRQPEKEVIHKMHLGPPGLMNPYLPSYESNTYKAGVRHELTNHTYAHPIKEDKTLN